MSVGYCSGWRRELKRSRARSEPDTPAHRRMALDKLLTFSHPSNSAKIPPHTGLPQSGMQRPLLEHLGQNPWSSSVGSVFVVLTSGGTFGSKSNCCIIYRISGG